MSGKDMQRTSKSKYLEGFHCGHREAKKEYAALVDIAKQAAGENTYFGDCHPDTWRDLSSVLRKLGWCAGDRQQALVKRRELNDNSETPMFDVPALVASLEELVKECDHLEPDAHIRFYQAVAGAKLHLLNWDSHINGGGDAG